ncbi:MAG: alpha/beta fold hydrolase [Candidatus Thorarchaeota archaeon]
MPYISSSDGTQIFYEVLGEGDIVLVFVGGLGAPTGTMNWEYQLSFSSKYKLVLIDLAGHGKSQTTRENYTMPLYGQDVKAVVEHLDLTNVILIGPSLGGAVILEAERLIPERTLGLIPVDSLFPISSFPNSLFERLDDEQIREILKLYEEDFVAAFTALFESMLSDKWTPEAIKLFGDSIPQLDERSMISSLIEACKWDFLEVLPEIKKPIKPIVAGRTLPEKTMREEYNRIFDAVYLEGIGHIMNLEDPEAFNTILQSRIKEMLN